MSEFNHKNLLFNEYSKYFSKDFLKKLIVIIKVYNCL
jgi:hypothetical protein